MHAVVKVILHREGCHHHPLADHHHFDRSAFRVSRPEWLVAIPERPISEKALCYRRASLIYVRQSHTNAVHQRPASPNWRGVLLHALACAEQRPGSASGPSACQAGTGELTKLESTDNHLQDGSSMRMKRECGEVGIMPAKSAAAPATVSGKPSANMSLGETREDGV